MSPSALAAAQFVLVGVHHGIHVEVEVLHDLPGASHPLVVVGVVRRKRLLEVGPDGLDRVERTHRPLRDECDLLPANALCVPGPEVENVDRVPVFGVVHDLTAGNAWVFDGVEDGRREHRLARPRLPHDAEDFAPVDVDVDVVEDAGLAPSHIVGDVRVADFEDRILVRRRFSVVYLVFTRHC